MGIDALGGPEAGALQGVQKGAWRVGWGGRQGNSHTPLGAPRTVPKLPAFLGGEWSHLQAPDALSGKRQLQRGRQLLQVQEARPAEGLTKWPLRASFPLGVGILRMRPLSGLPLTWNDGGGQGEVRQWLPVLVSRTKVLVSCSPDPAGASSWTLRGLGRMARCVSPRAPLYTPLTCSVSWYTRVPK